MKDEVECAKLVFGIFQRYRRENPGVKMLLLSFDHDEPRQLGLSEEEFESGLLVLEQKQLIQAESSDYWVVTSRGREACLHPERLDRLLGPLDVAVPPSHSVTIHNSGQLSNAQFGHGSTMTVNYQLMLSTLVQAIEQSSDIPPQKKAEWSQTLRDIMDHPAAKPIIAIATALGIEALK